MVCYDRTTFVNLESEGAKNLTIEKIPLKLFQIKYIINQKNIKNNLKISSWNMILISNDFCHKRKMYNLTHTMYWLTIATKYLCYL